MPHAGARTCAAVAHGRPMRAGINAPTPPTSSSRPVENVIFSQPRGRASGWPMGTSSAPGVEVRGSNRHFEIGAAGRHRPPASPPRSRAVRRHCALVESRCIDTVFCIVESSCVVLLLACSARSFIMGMRKKRMLWALLFKRLGLRRDRRATSERAPSRENGFESRLKTLNNNSWRGAFAELPSGPLGRKAATRNGATTLAVLNGRP